MSYLKNLSGITTTSIACFGSKRRVKEFLDLVANCGSVALAATKWGLSPLDVSEIINNDSKLQELIEYSLELALEIAEGRLYERAVNGYVEENIVDGVCVGSKKKFSDSCLMNYLKANSGKYGVKIAASNNKLNTTVADSCDIEMKEFTEPEDKEIKGNEE